MRFPLLTTLIALAIVACQAQAHFIWLEIEPASGVVRMRFSEAPGEATPPEMQEKAKPMTVLNEHVEEVAFTPGKDALEAKIPEDIALLQGALVYGVLDKTAEGRGKFLLNYYAKAARVPLDAKSVLGSPVEITAEWGKDTLHVSVLHDNAPAREVEVLLESAGSSETVKRITGPDGRAEFPLPAPGRMGLRAKITEPKSGVLDGKDYPEIRSYATLTVDVPAKATP